jgi:hypothetical protein
LKEIAISKYRDKKKLPGIYSLWDLSPTVGICLNIFEETNANAVNNDSVIKLFQHRLMTDDPDVLDKIVELSKKNNL